MRQLWPQLRDEVFAPGYLASEWQNQARGQSPSVLKLGYVYSLVRCLVFFLKFINWKLVCSWVLLLELLVSVFSSSSEAHYENGKGLLLTSPGISQAPSCTDSFLLGVLLIPYLENTKAYVQLYSFSFFSVTMS